MLPQFSTPGTPSAPLSSVFFSTRALSSLRVYLCRPGSAEYFKSTDIFLRAMGKQ